MPIGSGVDTLDVLRIPELSAGALNALFVPVTNVSQYKWISLYIGSGVYNGLLVPQISFDGVVWLAIKMYPMLSLDAGAVSGGGFDSVTNGLYGFPVIAPFFQVVMQSYTTGTATGELDLYTNGLPGFQMLESYVRSQYGDIIRNASSPVLASAVITGDGHADFPNNYSAKGLRLYIIPGVFGSGASNIVVTVQELDLISNSTFDILATTALVASTPQILKIYPGIASVANQAADDFLPVAWRVTWQATNWGAGGSTLEINAALNG